MADISMCLNEACPSRMQCYRFTAPVSEYRQAYAGFKVPDGQDRCDSFWSNGKRQEEVSDDEHNRGEGADSVISE